MSTNRDLFFENSEEEDFCYHLLTDDIAFDDDDCEFVTAAPAAATAVAPTAVALAALRSPVNTQQSVQEKNKSKSPDTKASEQASSTFSASTPASITFGFAASHSQETTTSSDREEVISESNFIGISN